MTTATKNAKTRLAEKTATETQENDTVTATATVEAPEKAKAPKRKLTKAEMVAKLKAQVLKFQADLAQAEVEAEVEANPKLAALAERLKAATKEHKGFHRLIVLREKKIRNARASLAELTDGKFDEEGKLKVDGLTQILTGQARAAKALAKIQKAVDKARAEFAPAAPAAPATEG